MSSAEFLEPKGVVAARGGHVTAAANRRLGTAAPFGSMPAGRVGAPAAEERCAPARLELHERQAFRVLRIEP